MSSEVLDIAIVCKDAAKEIVDRLDGFEIYGSCVENSDLIVTKVKYPKKIGVTQNKDYQIDLIHLKLGEDIECIPIIGQALPYALENGQVDAIVIDACKGVYLQGEKSPLSTSDYITYVLVVSKKIKSKPEFKKFIENYNIQVKNITKSSKIWQNNFEIYTNGEVDIRRLESWRIKLLSITEELNIKK